MLWYTSHVALPLSVYSFVCLDYKGTIIQRPPRVRYVSHVILPLSVCLQRNICPSDCLYVCMSGAGGYTACKQLPGVTPQQMCLVLSKPCSAAQPEVRSGGRLLAGNILHP